MRLSAKLQFFDSAQSRVSSQPSWRMRHSLKRPALLQRFSILKFAAEQERQFWHERHQEVQAVLKVALLLGSASFLALVILDIYADVLVFSEILARLLTVLVLVVLFIRLKTHPRPESQIKRIAKLSSCLSLIWLSGILLLEHNPAFYTDTWLGLLPIYFFTYGQMFMPIADTLLFGLLTLFVLPVTGYVIGVEAIALMPSIFILAMINAFGFYTRFQLEVHARSFFQERCKAESVAAEKTLFLRQLSHNLRQPLQALSCFASALETSFQAKQDAQNQLIIDKLGATIDELNNTFSRVLEIANLEMGRQIPRLVAVEINALLTTIENQFTPLANKRGLSLKVRRRLQAPYLVESDPCILLQVLSNLVDNAIKYTVDGWILVEAVNVGDNQLKLHVCDTGIGIAEKQKHEIFKEFYRGQRRQEDRSVQGLGIGLAYVIKAIEHLPGHELSLNSQINRGSDFQISLPVAEVSPSCAAVVGSELDACVAKRFVLIVDDDPDVRNALAEQLTGWGCIVQTAGSKAETLALLSDNLRPPDLLITDFYLDKQETAHDIIAAVEADCGPVAILILSAHAISCEDKAKLPDTIFLLRKPTRAAALRAAMIGAMAKLAKALPVEEF